MRKLTAAAMALMLCGTGVLAQTQAPAPAPASAPTLRDRLPAEVLRNGVLRFVGDSHPPYRILDDDRRIRDGIDADLARALAPVLGIPIRHQVVNSLSGTLAGLESGRYDVAMGPALPTKDRLVRFDAVTWLVSYPSFVYPTHKPRRFAKVEDLCGVKVAYVAGSISERVTNRIGDRCATAGLKRPSHVPLVDSNMTMVATQAGRADVAAMTSTAALHVVHENGGLFGAFRDPENKLGVDVLGLFVTQRSGLGPVLRDAMAELFKRGEYQRVMAKWGIEKVAVQAPQLHTSAPGAAQPVEAPR
jgi:polar amino acid transport system substrate-binding protein